MPDPQYSEVQISVPLGTLVKAIDQLPTEALSQFLHAAETALAARAGARPEEGIAQVEDATFWDSELGRYISEEADMSISIEDVRQALAVIPGTLAVEISRERDER